MISISILKVILIFAILCFHVFNKMTIRRIKINQRNLERETVEEQIGKMNFEYTIMLVNFIHKKVFNTMKNS